MKWGPSESSWCVTLGPPLSHERPISKGPSSATHIASARDAASSALESAILGVLRKRSFPGLLAVGLALAVPGCALVFGFDPLLDVERDASTTTPTDSAPLDSGPACRAEIGFPPRPPTTTELAEPVVYFAARDLALSVEPTLNLDATCTETFSDPRSCDSTSADQRLLDGPQGQDLAGLGVLSAGVGAGLELGFGGTRLEADNKYALVGLIVGVQGWNGSTDSNVSVELLTTRGIASDTDAGGGFIDLIGSNTTFTPARTDRWRPEASAYANDLPVSYTADAWVVDGTLVAHFVTKPARIAISRAYYAVPRQPDAEPSPIEIPLYDAWLIAGIDADGLHDARVMGSWNVDDLFDSIGGVYGVTDFVCRSPALRAFAQAEVCAVRDLRIDVGTPGRECNALSYAYGFTGYRVDALGPVDAKKYADGCTNIVPIRCDVPEDADAAVRELDAAVPDADTPDADVSDADTFDADAHDD